jgi:hypothetical protein
MAKNELSADERRDLEDKARRGEQLPSGYAVDFSQDPPFRKLSAEEESAANRAAATERVHAAEVEKRDSPEPDENAEPGDVASALAEAQNEADRVRREAEARDALKADKAQAKE